LPETGALKRHLQQFGESLCRMTIAVENLATARRYLDEHSIKYTYRDRVSPTLWIDPREANGAAIALREEANA